MLLCAKHKVKLGPLAAAAVEAEKQSGKATDRAAKQLSSKEKKKAELEKMAAKAQADLEKAKAALAEVS